MYKPSSVTAGTGPLGTDSTVKSKSFYTAIRDFDYALRAVVAASPRQILAQGKDVMRKFDAIIDACAANAGGEKGRYFQHLKIRAQNAKTRAVGPLLRAVENASQFNRSRPRLMSILGTFDLQGVGHDPHDTDVIEADSDTANHKVALYRLDQLLNAGLIGETRFAMTPDNRTGIVQKPDPELNDPFDTLLSADATISGQSARLMRRQNQRGMLEMLLKSPADIADLPPYADAVFGFAILALDGEMLTLVMDDLLDMRALGELSQQLIEVHAYLLHLELDGQMYNPGQWKSAVHSLLF